VTSLDPSWECVALYVRCDGVCNVVILFFRAACGRWGREIVVALALTAAGAVAGIQTHMGALLPVWGGKCRKCDA
jgi:hypothetical protein